MSGPFDAFTGEQELSQQQPLAIVGVLTWRQPTIQMAILPKYNYVFNVRVDIIEAFSAGNITVGNDIDPDAYMTSLSGAGTGVQSVSLGSGIGYDDAARRLQAAVSDNPTSGKAIIIVEFHRVPRVN